MRHYKAVDEGSLDQGELRKEEFQSENSSMPMNDEENEVYTRRLRVLEAFKRGGRDASEAFEDITMKLLQSDITTSEEQMYFDVILQLESKMTSFDNNDFIKMFILALSRVDATDTTNDENLSRRMRFAAICSDYLGQILTMNPNTPRTLVVQASEILLSLFIKTDLLEIFGNLADVVHIYVDYLAFLMIAPEVIKMYRKSLISGDIPLQILTLDILGSLMLARDERVSLFIIESDLVEYFPDNEPCAYFVLEFISNSLSCGPMIQESILKKPIIDRILHIQKDIPFLTAGKLSSVLIKMLRVGDARVDNEIYTDYLIRNVEYMKKSDFLQNFEFLEEKAHDLADERRSGALEALRTLKREYISEGRSTFE